MSAADTLVHSYSNAVFTAEASAQGRVKAAISSAKVSQAVGTLEGLDTAHMRNQAQIAAGKSDPAGLQRNIAGVVWPLLQEILGGIAGSALVEWASSLFNQKDKAEQVAEDTRQAAEAIDRITVDFSASSAAILENLTASIDALAAFLKSISPQENPEEFAAAAAAMQELIDAAGSALLENCSSRDEAVGQCLDELISRGVAATAEPTLKVAPGVCECEGGVSGARESASGAEESGSSEDSSSRRAEAEAQIEGSGQCQVKVEAECSSEPSEPAKPDVCGSEAPQPAQSTQPAAVHPAQPTQPAQVSTSSETAAPTSHGEPASAQARAEVNISLGNSDGVSTPTHAGSPAPVAAPTPRVISEVPVAPATVPQDSGVGSQVSTGAQFHTEGHGGAGGQCGAGAQIGVLRDSLGKAGQFLGSVAKDLTAAGKAAMDGVMEAAGQFHTEWELSAQAEETMPAQVGGEAAAEMPVEHEQNHCEPEKPHHSEPEPCEPETPKPEPKPEPLKAESEPLAPDKCDDNLDGVPLDQRPEPKPPAEKLAHMGGVPEQAADNPEPAPKKPAPADKPAQSQPSPQPAPTSEQPTQSEQPAPVQKVCTPPQSGETAEPCTTRGHSAGKDSVRATAEVSVHASAAGGVQTHKVGKW